jgi:uncharacterized protein
MFLPIEIRIMNKCFIYSIVLFSFAGHAQSGNAYLDSMQAFRKNYIETHEVVKQADWEFLAFFPIDSNFRIRARVERTSGESWFTMKTSGKEPKVFRKYAKLNFSLNGKSMILFMYQSQSLMNSKEYKNYLFIPFTDASTGIACYGGGRYLECFVDDIKAGELELDFNKAYNPYCAYTTGYNCPIPPKENNLEESINAGEKNYGKMTH